jgi:hypothetical protein
MNLKLEGKRSLEGCDLCARESVLEAKLRERYKETTTLTYCQSKLIENRPMPSLLVAPPKIFVRVDAVLPVAFWAARHFNLRRCQLKKHIDVVSKITYGN